MVMFIKVYSGVVANANKTLKNTVKINELISKLNDEYLISQLRKFEEYEGINLWDLGKRATSKINVGDDLAISCRDNIYVGRIIGIIDDVNGAIGDVVGWARQFKQPWSNVIILKDVKTIPQEEKILNFIKEHDKYPFRILKNFLKLEDEEEKEFSNLIKRPLKTIEIKYPKKPALDLPSWLMEIINDIKKLKTDSKHQERAHESLIERFFENLGYERFNDIKFRIGRIDISISIEGKPVIVIEVKNYWNLNVKKDHDVVRQAYNYALTNGARFVIISNGDYYAIFDRDKGRTYMENLKGEFILSDLNKEDLELINFLKKDNLKKISKL